jgi:PAS domain S-box-containing protein
MGAFFDGVIGFSSLALLIAMIVFVRRRPDLRFNLTFTVMAAFVLCNGFLHLLSVWDSWHPNPNVSAILTAVTAALALFSAFAAWNTLPQALRVPDIAALILKTEQSQKEKVESENRFRAVFELAAVGIAIFDLDGNFVQVNDRYCEILGYRNNDLVGRNFKSLTHPDDLKDNLNHLALLRSGQADSYIYEKRYIRKDGRKIWVVTAVTLVRDAEGEPDYYMTVARDVSQRREADADLRRMHNELEERVSQRTLELARANNELAKAKKVAEDANSAKTNFLANISHELRTPLSIIKGFCDLLLEEKSIEPSQKHYIKRIDYNAHLLLDLIKDLLDLSKVESGKLDINQQVIAIEPLVEEVLECMRPEADKKGIELLLHKVGPIPEKITSDPSRLRQILLNLVCNAIKFTQKGSVEVSLATQRATSGSKLLIAVKDSGLGIDPAEAKKLFRPFAQANKRISGKFGGTGLGLMLSRNLARALGGDVHLQNSTPGHGSTFVLTLGFSPAFVKEKKSALPKLLPARKLKGMRVAVVDDMEEQRMILAEYLRAAGAEVQCFEDGKCVLSEATAHPDDLILMDLKMPKLNGYNAAKRLREIGHRGPIIALTAFTVSGTRERCLRLGFNDHVFKPIDRAALIDLVAKYAPSSPEPKENLN